MNRVERTAELHESGGLSCSQAILTAYGKPYGIDSEKARLLGRTLAGGIGGRGETCGYVSAAILILAHAHNHKDEAKARKETHPAVMEFIRRFIKRYGTTMCKELLGADMSSKEGFIKIKAEGLVAKHCYEYGRDAAEILEELLEL